MNSSAAAPIDNFTRLGRYRLLERIGGGVTSMVYAAHDDGMERRVAVKMIAAELNDEPEARERFYREARVTTRLVHRNIVAVLDIGEDEGRPYLVMELLQGQPLGEYLRSGNRPSLHVTLDLIQQLCRGLQAAHDCGVVHRDIKPSNLFLQQDGCLKILDFGLARLQASTLTASGQILGTPDFMSPEQASGTQVDARSDIFSAGAVGYRMLTGRAPFTGPNLRSTLLSLLNDDPPPAPIEAPDVLGQILLKALSKDPAGRYQSCSDMFMHLERVTL